MNKNTVNVAGALAVAFLLFAQVEALALEEVQRIRSWNHSLTTEKSKPGELPASEFSHITDAENVRISPKLNGLKIQGLVRISHTTSDVLKPHIRNFRLVGEEGVTYPIVYDLTPRHLMVYKVLPENGISVHEEPYSILRGSDRLVPLGGFEAKYYNFEVGKAKKEVEPARFDSASHVQLSPEFIPFKPFPKRNVFPAAYFTEGEWYFAKAVVASKPGAEDAIGYFHGGVSTGFEFANKIRFRQHKGYLRGLNVAVAEQKKRVEKKEGESQNDVLTIPVEWHDFELKMNGEFPALEEVPNDFRPHHKRRYGVFHFESTNMLESKSFDERVANIVISSVNLEDLQLDEDGFSYTLTHVGTGEKTRYSFRRVKPSTYKPLVYRKSESDIFGAFYTVKPYVITSKDDRKGDLEIQSVINRFDPKKNIVFRFSKDTPKFDEIKKDQSRLQIDYREIGRRCTKYWNRAFELAGTDVTVTLQEDIDGEVGDISSNIINIIDTLNESGLAGVGPSLADPESGEIVAGAANVYIAAYKSRITETLRNYIRLRSGLARDYAFSKEIQAERRLMAHTQNEVEYFCPNVVKFADSLQGRPQETSAVENVQIDRCLEKLLPRILVEITCHEMGHVFGLRHNFQCSADRDNSFQSLNQLMKVYPKSKFPEIYSEYYPRAEFMPQSSCVMDYMPDNRPTLYVPGPYDIAAVAFTYSGKLFKADGRDGSLSGLGDLISFDQSRELKAQPAFAESRKFAYCDDLEAGYSKAQPINPLCMRHDFGNTPTALLDHYFDALRDELVLNYRKWDRISAIETGRPGYYMEQMSRIYKLWRAYLFDHLGQENANLQKIRDEEASEALRADLMANFKPREFLGVSERYAKYMKSIVDIPDFFCVAVRKDVDKKKVNLNSDVKLFSFSRLHQEIVSSGLASGITGCSDPLIATYMLKERPDFEVTGEIGYPTSNVQFSTDKNDRFEGVDIVGISEIRRNAVTLLTINLGMDAVYELKRRNHIPSPLDEPEIFNSVMAASRSRLFDGLDVTTPIIQTLSEKGFEIDQSVVPRPFRKFEADWEMYATALKNIALFRMPQRGLSIEEREAPKAPFVVGVSRSISKRRDREAYYFSPHNNLYFFASPSARLAYDLINRIRQMEEPAYFDLGLIDATVQDAGWQLAELIKDFPVNSDHAKVKTFNFSTFSTFIGRLKDARQSGRLTQSISQSPHLSKIFEALTRFSDRIDALVLEDRSQMQKISSGTKAAGKVLREIQTRESMFRDYFRLHAGFEPDDLLQENLMEAWVSEQSSAVQNHWQNYMKAQMRERVSYYLDDPREYEQQRMALLSVLTQGTEQVARDDLN